MPHNYSEVVPHIYPILLNFSVDRNELRHNLLEAGIQTGVHYKPNHHLSFYSTSGVSLEKTDSIYPRLLTLPLHLDMKEADIDIVCDNLFKLIKNKMNLST